MLPTVHCERQEIDMSDTTNAFNHGAKKSSLRIMITELTSTSATIAWPSLGAKHYNLRINGQLYQCNDTYYRAVDLTPNTIYFVAVTAIGDTNTLAQQIDAKFITRIASPNKFELVSLTVEHCVCQWQRVNGASSYLLYLNGTIAASLDAAITTYQYDNLVPGTLYTFGVAAKHSDGFITKAQEINATTALSVPTNFSATTTHMAAYLSWDLVLNATKYSIQCLEYNTERIICADTTTALSYTCNGLDPQTQYLFRIKAHNQNAESSARDISRRTLFPLPSVPLLAEPTKIHSTGFTANWKPVCDWDGTTHYHLYLNGQLFHTISGAENCAHTLRGLTPATSYSFAVKSINKTGESALSRVILVRTIEHLERPQQLYAEKTTNHSCLLRWSSVSGATQYVITVNGIEHATVSTTKYELVGLSASTVYKITIQAADQLGASLPSTPISVRTLMGIPNAPMNLRVSNISADNFRVDWEQIPDVQFYNVYIAEAHISSGNMILYGKVSKNYIIVSNRKPNVSYSVNVVAHNQAGQSDVSAVSVLTAPLAPSAINAVAAADQLTIQWPQSEGAVVYKLRINDSVTTTQHLKLEWQNNVLPNTQYDIVVSAINANGVESTTIQTTVKTPLAMPRTPEQVVAQCHVRDATISWSVALYATHYNVYCNANVYTVHEPRLFLTNLEPGRQYQIQVESVNEHGVSHQVQVGFTTLFENPIVKCMPYEHGIILQWANVASQYRLYFQGTEDRLSIQPTQESPINLYRQDLSYCDEQKCELQITGINEPTKWQFAITTINKQECENKTFNWSKLQQ